MEARGRPRLATDVFDLPVERIRAGYYSDAYFNHAKELLERTGRHPRVVVQVFQKHDS
ncbi:MAG: nicotinate phosphoribosyltransferase, partial [Solirubrobacteraceae bacterium]|nr:nicotinate phosphoribosyltransferase [Solirubrobacteraceae bacterium]